MRRLLALLAPLAMLFAADPGTVLLDSDFDTPPDPRWQEMLNAGEVSSVTDLAERLNGDRSYASSILRLNLLAPDIVEAILAGR